MSKSVSDIWNTIVWRHTYISSLHLWMFQFLFVTQLLQKREQFQQKYHINTQCLKITEKVSINSMSKASYIFILSGQKFLKNAKNGSFWRVFENLKLAVKQVSFNRTKIGGKCQNLKRSNEHLSNFQTMCVFMNLVLKIVHIWT